MTTHLVGQNHDKDRGVGVFQLQLGKQRTRLRILVPVFAIGWDLYCLANVLWLQPHTFHDLMPLGVADRSEEDLFGTVIAFHCEPTSVLTFDFTFSILQLVI